jgi:pimeloyl-ACP methyl ester carboxylesterase
MTSGTVSVCFAHGKESGPWGVKIRALSAVAREKGCRVESVDYTDLSDADPRVARLLGIDRSGAGRIVLVGSSMGAYVSVVASGSIRPAGLFLMAPALYMDRYADRDPAPTAGRITVVHGWFDEVVPVEQAIRFARKHGARLFVVPGDHALIDHLPFLERLFGLFLDEVAADGPVPS